MADETLNPYLRAQFAFREAVETLRLVESIYEMLKQPMRTLKVSCLWGVMTAACPSSMGFECNIMTPSGRPKGDFDFIRVLPLMRSKPWRCG